MSECKLQDDAASMLERSFNDLAAEAESPSRRVLVITVEVMCVHEREMLRLAGQRDEENVDILVLPIDERGTKLYSNGKKILEVVEVDDERFH